MCSSPEKKKNTTRSVGDASAPDTVVTVAVAARLKYCIYLGNTRNPGRSSPLGGPGLGCRRDGPIRGSRGSAAPRRPPRPLPAWEGGLFVGRCCAGVPDRAVEHTPPPAVLLPVRQAACRVPRSPPGDARRPLLSAQPIGACREVGWWGGWGCWFAGGWRRAASGRPLGPQRWGAQSSPWRRLFVGGGACRGGTSAGAAAAAVAAVAAAVAVVAVPRPRRQEPGIRGSAARVPPPSP